MSSPPRLQQVSARRRRGGAIFFERSDDILAGNPLVNFVWAIDQALRSNVRVPGGERCIGGVAESAVQLDRSIDDFVNHIGEEDFCYAILLVNIEAVLSLVSNVHQHQTRDVELARTLREHELNALALLEALSERGALRHMGGCQIECTLRHGDIVHAMAKTPIGEAMLPHGKSLSFAAQ